MMARSDLTAYFDGEGRRMMQECVRLSFEWCASEGITTMVVFTGTGEGPHYAAKEFLTKEPYTRMKMVAVTPPAGRPYRLNPAIPDSPLVRAGVTPAMRDELSALGISIISAHLPFKETYDGRARTSVWTRVAEAYGVLGGGFALCVQAVLVACDAGAIPHGERVVSMSADTSIVASACRTESFLAPTEGLLVGHIICRPLRYDISKRMHETIASPPQAPSQSLQVAHADRPVSALLPSAPVKQWPVESQALAAPVRPKRRRKKPT
jgi:hypothetical protein